MRYRLFVGAAVAAILACMVGCRKERPYIVVPAFSKGASDHVGTEVRRNLQALVGSQYLISPSEPTGAKVSFRLVDPEVRTGFRPLVGPDDLRGGRKRRKMVTALKVKVEGSVTIVRTEDDVTDRLASEATGVIRGVEIPLDAVKKGKVDIGKEPGQVPRRKVKAQKDAVARDLAEKIALWVKRD